MYNDAFDIIIVAGQSNAEGYGVGEVTEKYVPDERALFLDDSANARFEKNEQGKDVFTLEFPTPIAVSVADEPIGDQGRLGKLSLFFVKRYMESGRLAEGRKLLVVNAAVGGTGFARGEWGTGGILYERLKHMTNEALKHGVDNRIVAFLWHQGECDSVENGDWAPEMRYEVHKSKLTAMLDDFCSLYGCPELPMISAGFCNEWYLKNKVPCDAVLKAIDEVFSGERRRFLKTDDLLSNNEQTANGDDIHFSRESLHILGERYFDAYCDITAKHGDQ